MASLNKVQLIGALGADPEVRSFQNGGKVCNLRLATSEKWKDKATGETKEQTEWHSVSIFSEGLAGIAERYLRKGSKVYVEGQLKTRKWQDQSGNDRYSTEIVLNGPKATLVLLSSNQGGQQQNNDYQAQSGQQQPSGSYDDDLDDDLPF